MSLYLGLYGHCISQGSPEKYNQEDVWLYVYTVDIHYVWIPYL